MTQAAPVGWAGPLGGTAVGIDAVEVPRFRRALERRAGLAGRLFSAAELAYAGRFSDPAPRLAARFAAKEAALKALGVGLGSVRFRDLEVRRAPSGAPSLRAEGRAAALAQGQGVTGWEVSLTHTDLVALAVVLACRGDRGGVAPGAVGGPGGGPPPGPGPGGAVAVGGHR